MVGSDHEDSHHWRLRRRQDHDRKADRRRLAAVGIAAYNHDEDVVNQSDYPELQVKRLNTLANRKISITIETVQTRRFADYVDVAIALKEES